VDETLIAWRALHFAATIQVAGAVLFRLVILHGIAPSGRLQRWLGRTFWVSLAVVLASGLAWLLSVASAIDDTSWNAALSDGTVATVVADTQFGNAWTVRFGAAIALALAVAIGRGRFQSTIVLLCVGIIVGGLAFAGHGASSAGAGGDLHLGADILHLLAVAAWIGELFPFALLLAFSDHPKIAASGDPVPIATRRFSDVALAAVLTILVTGMVNTIYLVGSPMLLVTTDYGRLLSLKLVVFVFMLAIAAVNRLVFVPRISQGGTDALKRNAIIEIALGVTVILIVAVLGTLPPAMLDAGTLN
jgi:putative copper resistance protein D